MKNYCLNRFVLITLVLICTSLGVAYGSDGASESTLSYGMVKKYVKPGESSQLEILKLFGSPDNMVLKKGKESWIYDRYKVETSVSSESGYGSIIIAGTQNSKVTTSSSVRNITVIIEFNEKGVVEDVSMRVGGY